MLDIYPGLYPLSKTLASCRTFDCIFPNDALSLIKVHCSMQSFDVRFCKEYAVVYLIKIYLLIPKILHLNCKAIMLKIIFKKKNREKIAIIERESERIRDRDSCWIYKIFCKSFFIRVLRTCIYICDIITAIFI